MGNLMTFKLVKNQLIPLLVCTVLGTPLASQEVSIDDAVAQWLEGDDENSLASLSRLAGAGDISARLLLGQIDRDIVEGGASDYVQNLKKVSRDQLLRKVLPDGGSVNWLRSLDEPAYTETGDILFHYRILSSSADAAGRLFDVDEFDAAEYMIWATMNTGRFDKIGDLGNANPDAVQGPLLEWLQAWLESDGIVSMAQMERDETQVKIAGLLLLDRIQGILSTSYVITDEIDGLISVLKGRIDSTDEGGDSLVLRQNLIDISQSDPYLRNLTDLCSRCEGDRVDPECITEALRIIGGYRTLMRVRSPVQTVIPSEEFEVSPKASMILQQLIVSRSEAYAPALRSQCVREWTE